VVALDRDGNLAAATSTGGVWLKWPGRVGDSPIPGAGYYAENGVGAFSATGIGEVITLSLLSYRARNELLKTGDVAQAVKNAVQQVTAVHGPDTAGLIGLDARGNPAYAYNAKAMARGWGKQGEIYVDLQLRFRHVFVSGSNLKPIFLSSLIVALNWDSGSLLPLPTFTTISPSSSV